METFKYNCIETAELDPISVEEIEVCMPHGQCAGVNAALAATYEVLQLVDGRIPVFAHNEIVHYDPVVNNLRAMGLQIVRDFNFDEITPESVYIPSAHGAAIDDIPKALEKGCIVFDTSCQIVRDEQKKVAELNEQGTNVLVLSKPGHPEGRAVKSYGKEGMVQLIGPKKENAAQFVKQDGKWVVVEQTTLGWLTDEIIEELKEQHPDIDFSVARACYATRNRQDAVKQVREHVDGFLVVGSPKSSNGTELLNLAGQADIPSHLVDLPENIDWNVYQPNSGIKKLGITSAASVPEGYLYQMLKEFEKRGSKITFQDPPVAKENINAFFNLPNYAENMQQLYERLKDIPHPDTSVPSDPMLEELLGVRQARELRKRKQ